jgi:electron transfer flavoprotein alpha subunit
MSGVWVWIEQDNGNIAAISQEALGTGRRIADELGARALLRSFLAMACRALPTKRFSYGADAVVGMDDATLATFRVDAYGHA